MSTEQTAKTVFNPELFKQEEKDEGFAAITLALASPEKIRSWSFGEVRLPETINYRTFKPEPGGLFCAKIFGPIRDYECLCGKYKRLKSHKIICEKCGVEVTLERVRRERMGHITLASPVAHILFFKSVPSRIGIMLNLTMRDIERILYFEAYVVLDPRRVDDREIDRGKLLNVAKFQEFQRKYGEESFSAGIGAEGLRDYMRKMDLDEEAEILRNESEVAGVATPKGKKILKRLRLIESFRRAGLRPEWMILETLPVLPPNLRPLVQLEGVRFTTSDLNDLYRRVINRNNRLRKLIELDAPEIIVNNEKRMLQEAVDSLLDNGRRGKPAVGVNKRPLKSLADLVKGKTGRFRQNLLGKRVDFSARSVIVVGPSLKLHECGLPKEMAMSLFRPYVFFELMRQGLALNIKQARHRADDPDSEVWDVLEKVIRQHPVLLNRAPTLHRLGIQAFDPVLIEGKAIQLHPLVCAAFNADFDGDQMAVHVPLSMEAQAEARVLMLSSNNILSPANGEPIILPSQDIVLGIYYATRHCVGARGEGMKFADLSELATAHAQGFLGLQAEVEVLLATSRVLGEVVADEADSRPQRELVKTTAGRALMLDFLPDGMPFEAVNRTLKKKDLSGLVGEVFRRCGLRETVVFADNLMQFGFKHATRAGISICMSDMLIPKDKKGLIADAEKQMREARRQFNNGLLTMDERYNKCVDVWDKAGDEVTRSMMSQLSRQEVLDKAGKGTGKTQESFNSLYMMADSGARGSQTQIKQLAGMRGLMQKPDGRIMETAITANFREGLTPMQYFLSTHGARKGLTDTALKTANSGYMTRRLVDVSQDVVVREEDCGTTEGVTLRAVLDGGETVVPLAKRILGRYLARDVTNPQTSETLLAAGEIVNEEEAEKISVAGVDEVTVRSAVRCKLPHGLCVKCYGRDLARGVGVKLGEAVGVIAAQSIGEPGTQLTMRTFHIGGAASRVVTAKSVEAKQEGVLRINARVVEIEEDKGKYRVVSREGEMSLHEAEKDQNGNVKVGRERGRYLLRYGDVLRYKDGETVKAGAEISTSVASIRPLIAECGGKVVIEGGEEGVNYLRQVDDATGIENWLIIEDTRAVSGDKRAKRSRRAKEAKQVHVKFLNAKGDPVMAPGTDKEVSMALDPGMTLEVREGQHVGVGAVIASRPAEASKTRDITGGLPRVAELFEAREPKDPFILSHIDGRVEFPPLQHEMIVTEEVIVIVTDKGEEYPCGFPPHGELLVKDGDLVKKGQELVKFPSLPAKTTGALTLGRRGGQQKIIITDDEGKERMESFPEGGKLLVKEGSRVKNGQGIFKEKPICAIVAGKASIRPKHSHKSIPKGSALLVKEGDRVERNQVIAKGGNITATASGEIAFVMPKNAKQEVVIVTDKNKERRRQFKPDSVLLVKHGDKVKKDQQIIKQPPLQAQSTGTLTVGRRSGVQKIIITDDEGKEKTRNFPAKGKLLVKEGARVKRDQDIAEDAPICAIATGTINIRSLDSELEAVIKSENGKEIARFNGKGRIRWLVEEGDTVEKDQAIAEGVSTHSQSSGFVTGLRRIHGAKKLIHVHGEKMVEKDSIPSSPREGEKLIEVEKEGTKVRYRWESRPIAANRTVLVQEGASVKRGDEIVEGETCPHEILHKRGIEALAAHIVDEVQSVYRMQGVTINDKHIEVIVRQMLRCVIVTDPGDSVYLLEDKLVMSQVMEENERLQAEGKRPLKYRSILLGITKASLATDSVISAASFQETTRVLTDAAVAGKHDNLRGLKENVIIGRIIPAGTGFVHYQQKDRPEETDAAEKTLFEEFSKSADEEGDDEPPTPAANGEAGGGAEATAGEG